MQMNEPVGSDAVDALELEILKMNVENIPNTNALAILIFEKSFVIFTPYG